MGQMVTDFTWYLRNLLLAKTSEDIDEILEVSKEQLELLRQEAQSCDVDLLIRFIRIFSELSNQVKFATQKRVIIEVALVKLCKPMMENDLESILQRIRILEDKIEHGVFAATPAENETDTNKEPEIEVEIPKALSEDLKLVAQNWREIINRVGSPEKITLISAKVVPGEGNLITLLFDNEVDEGFIKRKPHLDKIRKAIQETIHKEVTIQTKTVGSRKEMNQYPDLTKLIKNIPVEYVD